MGIMDNEGHDPMGLGNIPRHTGSTALALERDAFERQYRQACQDHATAMAEIKRLREQLSHAVPAIEQLTKEREEYRTRWLASEVELRLALEALAHEGK